MLNQTIRVLIVDNDEGMVKALSTRLEFEGYECQTATSGSQGYAAIKAYNFDIIISDLNMPMGDGIDFAHKVRQLNDTPIIFVTGFEKEYCKETSKIHNVSVLQKPLHPTQLLDMIEIDLELSYPSKAA